MYISYVIWFTLKYEIRCDSMKSYVISSTSLHIPRTGKNILLWPSMPEQAIISDCTGCYQHENRDSRTSAVSDSRRSTIIFACLVPGAAAPVSAQAAPAASRRRLTVSPTLSQHTVAAHSDPALMPLCFIIYQTWLPGWPHLRRGIVRGLVGYCPPWPLHQTAQTSLSWSSRRSVAAGSVLCSSLQGRWGSQGPKGRHWPASISWYTALSKPLSLRPRLSDPMPSPRRVIESHTRPSFLFLRVAVGEGKGLDSARKYIDPVGRTWRWRSAWRINSSRTSGEQNVCILWHLTSTL